MADSPETRLEKQMQQAQETEAILVGYVTDYGDYNFSVLHKIECKDYQGKLQFSYIQDPTGKPLSETKVSVGQILCPCIADYIDWEMKHVIGGMFARKATGK